MSGISGLTSLLPSARYDPVTCSWRTSLVTSLWDLPMSSVTLRRWGMTRRGELYELPTPELRTVALGCSSLLPTPAAHDSGNDPQTHLRKKPGRSQVTSLQVIVDHGLLSSGGRISPPSAGGKPSPDDQHPDLLSMDEPESA